MPVGLFCEAPPSIAAVLVGFPAAVAAGLLLLGWIREGELPKTLPAVAAIVLLVNLLAAGGIALPSVAGTFWLLLALGLHDRPRRTVRPIWGWTLLGTASVLLIACYFTYYSPVVTCQGQLRAAEQNPEQAVEHLQKAAAADPLSAEPWRRLAAIEFTNWSSHPTDDGFGRFERACGKMIELAPNSAAVRRDCGDIYMAAYSKSGRRECLEKAVECYGAAVELYPNNATNRAKLADALSAAGKTAEARRQAEAALKLDKTTPHADKKLPAELRNRLLVIIN